MRIDEFRTDDGALRRQRPALIRLLRSAFTGQLLIINAPGRALSYLVTLRGDSTAALLVASASDA